MTPLQFRSGDHLLYGVYHAALTTNNRPTAVLICPPFGEEAARAHRSLRRLSERLASRGCSVLRFDFRGTGDSSGGPEDATCSAWSEDILAASSWLVERSGATRLFCVACGLSAPLAEAAYQRAHDLAVDGVLAWVPVTDGAAYLSELAYAHQRACRQRGLQANERGQPSAPLGWPLPPVLADEIARIDMASLSSADFPVTRLDRVDAALTAEDARAWSLDHAGQPFQMAPQAIEKILEWLDAKR